MFINYIYDNLKSYIRYIPAKMIINNNITSMLTTCISMMTVQKQNRHL